MPKPARQEDEAQDPIAPAVITALHVQDRPVAKEAGAKLAWRSMSTIEACYDKGQLSGGHTRHNAETRYEAGLFYAGIFAASEPSGRDSTQAMNVSRSTNPGAETDARSDAWTKRISIESHMGQRDRMIVRMVCGENEWPSMAVRLTCSDYRHTVAARFREALDALTEAIEAARKSGWKAFSLGVRP